MLGIISKIFGGNKSEKDVKQILPQVAKINQFFKQYSTLTNDELRNKTLEFRVRIKDHLADIDGKIESRKTDAEALPFEDINGRDSIYKEIDELKKDRDKKIEEILQQLLPEAFAVVKETSRRFKENESLESVATDLDRELPAKKEQYCYRRRKSDL